MEKTNYKPGDQVQIKNKRGIGWNSNGKMDHWMGKILTLRCKASDGDWRMEEDIKERDGHGWRWSEDDFEPAGKEVVVVFRDGQKTVALHKVGKEVVNKSIARCCPDDKYDFMTGAKIAIDRIMGSEKQHDTIEVGDKVIITDAGRSYPIYLEWFSKFAPSYKYIYDGNCLCKGFKGVVVAKHEHECSTERMLCAVIVDGGKVGLINKEGIKKIS